MGVVGVERLAELPRCLLEVVQEIDAVQIGAQKVDQLGAVHRRRVDRRFDPRVLLGQISLRRCLATSGSGSSYGRGSSLTGDSPVRSRYHGNEPMKNPQHAADTMTETASTIAKHAIAARFAALSRSTSIATTEVTVPYPDHRRLAVNDPNSLAQCLLLRIMSSLGFEV